MSGASLQHEPAFRAQQLQRIADAHRASAAALEAVAATLDAIAGELAAPAPAAPDDDPMLTVQEAARELRRSASHVRSACRRGAIKALRDAHGYRIRRSALAAYERRRTA